MRLLNEEDGLKHAARLMRGALDAAAARDRLCAGLRSRRRRPGGKAASLDMLEFVRDELHLDPLIAAAIERGVRARHTRVE